MGLLVTSHETAQWSAWRRFPDPRAGGLIVAPIGAGAFELRHVGTGERVLFGAGEHVAERLTNLLPVSLGLRRRNNASKRQYILRHLDELEYRTSGCASRTEAELLIAHFDPRLYRFRI